MPPIRFAPGTPAALGFAAAALAATILGIGVAPASPTPEPFPTLAARGYRVSAGAAPGYVEDRACGSCHRDLWKSYRAVGMARSFYRATAERAVEDLAAAPFFHAPSGRYYEMALREGRYHFRRWQLDDRGERLHEIEQPVAWILGSGHTSRTYLVRNPAGELHELPLAWYAQTASWGMAPGFDRPDHQGLARRVRRECLFCHNAYPDVPAGSDAAGTPDVFPAELPEGIGCQRCHGPGAAHAELAMRGAFGSPELARTIVNPGGLSPERRDDVCFGCHLQPTIALTRVRRFGRADYSFRPGEKLTDFLQILDVGEDGRAPGERFEINHHVYRLRQSGCRQASGRQPSCLTCHDPHRKVPVAERAAHYRAACLGCHRPEQCGREHLTEASGQPRRHAAEETADCVACHMPRRRTEDVVQVVMTDHRIQRPPAGEDLLAARAEREPTLTEVGFLVPGDAPPGDLGQLYQAVAVVRSLPHQEVVDRLEKLVGPFRPDEPDPHFDLIRGQLALRRFPAAEARAQEVLSRLPEHRAALAWRAVARAGLGRKDEAVADLRRALASGGSPETEYNLGVLELGRGDVGAASEHLERALRARPTFATAWFYLGRVELARGRPREAVAALERALAVEPSMSRAYVELGRLLARSGERERALRLLRHGARWARPPEPVAELLAELSREEG